MSEPKPRTNAELIELARNWMRNTRRHHPKSTSIFKAITSEPKPLPLGELPEEITAEDYDDWIDQAYLDLARKPQRFHTYPDNPTLIECPRMRLLRIGDEAERNGTPSQLFRYLMEQTDNGAKLPHVTGRAMSIAQKYLNVAIGFKQFAKANSGKYPNFKELKLEFRRERDNMKIHVSESTLERALRAHDLNWSAYAIDAPRKGQRDKGGT